jgi:endonuclease/exonuclease/phosphatase family metal-dependent hydrolase
MDDLKNKYLDFIKSKKYYLKKKKKEDLRIATYNVHYWTDVWENNSIKQIMKDIKYINADIIILQEVIFGLKYKINNKIINTEKIIDILDNLGYYTIFCNTLSTWVGGIYGNMLCIKKKYKNDIDETNYTFPKSTKSCIVSGGKEGTKETRCYIQLEFLNYLIIGVHLDVCSETERKKQINHILNLVNKKKYKKKKIIILGDLNSTDIHQYRDADIKKNILKYVFNDNNYQMNNNIIQSLYKNKFKSATNPLNINLTVWSGIQSDYIFTKRIQNIEPQILYTDASDHLPLIIDITDRYVPPLSTIEALSKASIAAATATAIEATASATATAAATAAAASAASCILHGECKGMDKYFTKKKTKKTFSKKF